MKAYLALMRIDLKLALRNKAVLFFNYFFPLIFFFVFAQLFDAKQGAAINQVVTMVLALGILGNGLFGAGMRAVMDREANVLRRYKVTPISPVPLLIASIATGVLLFLPAIVLTLFLANRFYGMTVPHHLLSFFVFVCVGAIAFRAIGLIIASVVNSSQESNLLIQPLYMAMLFLSGMTIPITLFPEWLQSVTQFIPATHLMSGMAGIIMRNETAWQNWPAILALLITAAIATFIAAKLFRWEKEEKLRPAAKLWVLVALLPFLFLGAYQAWSREDLVKAKILSRELKRGRSWLIQNGRIFVGDGRVIESGSVLIRQGKIVKVYEGPAPEAKSLNAEPIEAAGKTILPGLIDVHVHLGATGGFYEDQQKSLDPKNQERALAAYLYSGITAVRSAGDTLETVLKLRAKFGSGEKLGAELFLCGPLFTTEGGHGTEYAKFMPDAMRPAFLAGFVRTPKSEAEARQQVAELAAQHVDAIKGVLEAGVPGYIFNRMDVKILGAVVDEARRRNLPSSIHTGNAADVADAVSLSPSSIEHGSLLDDISDQTLGEMKSKGVVLDPTLSVAEGFANFGRGDTSLLQRSLVQQTAPKELLSGTEQAAKDEKFAKLREGISHYPLSAEQGGRNLRRAWQAGVTLATGSDAGNFLVFHGPTVQHEIELWVAAGIPPEIALQAATANAAKLLRADNRLGTVTEGKEATLLVVDGNPLQDVHALSAISVVILKGERVARTELFEQK
ncbi:MAG TPA: amidohydrolase family protein [Chthoniobacterales bacterium]|nr:amidohydrolase family protein [Chthoniobacterales bacterium]